jgi:hypothetical protein
MTKETKIWVSEIEAAGVSEEVSTASKEVKPDVSTESAPSGALAEAPEGGDPENGTWIRSVWPGTLKIEGPSGRTYVWSSAGARLFVEDDDVEAIMGKNRNTGRACCGGSPGKTYFVQE